MTRSFHQPSHVRVLRQDPNPDESLVKMLAAFVESPESLNRYEAEVIAFGRTTYTATWAIDALNELKRRGYVEPTQRNPRRFRPTARGVAALQHRVAHDEAQRHPSNGGGVA